MANTRISAFTALTGASVDAAADVLPIVDISVTTTKKIVVSELGIALGVPLKATLASPTLTGTPAAPTAALNTNTTQLATTAFVINQIVGGSTSGAMKFWCRFDATGSGPFTPDYDFNVVDVTDNGVGDYTVNIGTDFAGATWAPMGGMTNYPVGDDNQSFVINIDGTDAAAITAGTLRVNCRRTSDHAARDPTVVSIGGAGDQ